MIHLVRASSMNLLRRSQLYQIFAVDFLLDKDMNLWFIETNSRPSLTPTTDEMEVFFTKLMSDSFEITSGLLRSRMKRVITMVNEITNQNPDFIEDDVDPNMVQDRFKGLIKNRFEPEFIPTPENGWEKIIDENLEGPARYGGYLEQKCMI